MFNPIVAKTNLIDAINRLEPGILGHRADATGLNLRAEYIKELCRLVAEHVEECAADADASSSRGNVGEEDAQIISDVGSDLAGRIEQAAELEAA